METPETPPDQGTPDPPEPLHPDLPALLAAAAEAPPGWSRQVVPESRLDADLRLDECELARLAELLTERFGPAADLAGLRAGLGLAELEALTVADLQRELLPRPSAEAAR